MTQRRSFDKNYLQREFDRLDAKTKQRLSLFLIGGGAMAFYDLKDATKDIDVILANEDSFDDLKTNLEITGYKEPKSILITRPHNDIQTSAILENRDGFRWDLFIRKVCNTLTLSTEMQQRASQLYTDKHLTILVASREDIFLFKGITTRDADLSDMRILAESGLDWNIINRECRKQSESSKVSWEYALHQKLLKLKARYNIQSPIEKSLEIAAERRIVETMLITQLQRGNNTVKSIAQQIARARLKHALLIEFFDHVDWIKSQIKKRGILFD